MGLLDLFAGNDDNKKDIDDESLFVTLFDNEKEEVTKNDWTSSDFDDETEDEDDYYNEDER